MGVVGINYNEFDPKTYKSVYVHQRDKKERVFDSGDFVKDWLDSTLFCVNDDSEGHWSNSSSVDHFIMDGASFDSAYLNVENGKPILKYEYDPEAVELFVKKGTTPTWEELKNMYPLTEKGK